LTEQYGVEVTRIDIGDGYEGEANNGVNMNACGVDQREFGRLLIVDQCEICAAQHDGLSAVLVSSGRLTLLKTDR
jgi:hypothetical protein